jgi:predicted nucleotidyltransferase
VNDRHTARVATRLKAILSRKPWVLAIFVTGSRVAGTAQPGSDLDFAVIVRRKSNREETLRVLKRHFRFLVLDHWVATFAGRPKPDIAIIDRPSMDRLLRLLYRSPQDFLRVRNFMQHKIVEAAPIYDPQRLLVTYQAKVATFPGRIQRAVYRRAIRSLTDAYENWGYRNEFNFAFELPSILDAIGLALYTRNRRLSMLPLKRLHKDLKLLKPNIESEVYRLARSGRSDRSRREGRAVLKRIIQRLGSGI